MKTYKLSLTERQAHVVRLALEAYSRLLHGQIDIVVNDVLCPRDHRDVIRNMADSIKMLVYPELGRNGYYGIGLKERPEASVAWDIMQVIRYKLNPDACPPMAFSGEELPTIED